MGAALTECVCLWADVESSLRVGTCKQIVESLPQHHFAVAHFLFGFLHEVTLKLNTVGGRGLTAAILCRSVLTRRPALCSPPQVSQESIVNKMSPSNLACVFGVNVVRPRHGSVSLSALTPINIFTEILIEHFHTVFAAGSTPAQGTA